MRTRFCQLTTLLTCYWSTRQKGAGLWRGLHFLKRDKHAIKTRNRGPCGRRENRAFCFSKICSYSFNICMNHFSSRLWRHSQCKYETWVCYCLTWLPYSENNHLFCQSNLFFFLISRMFLWIIVVLTVLVFGIWLNFSIGCCSLKRV